MKDLKKKNLHMEIKYYMRLVIKVKKNLCNFILFIILYRSQKATYEEVNSQSKIPVLPLKRLSPHKENLREQKSVSDKSRISQKKSKSEKFFDKFFDYRPKLQLQHYFFQKLSSL